jgi:very-short-patch-repair endonuclease
VPNHAFFDVAARQYGVLERAQIDLPDATLAGWVGDGRLLRVQPSVYRVGGAPITREQRLLAACLAAGPGSAVSHQAAAHEWGLGDFLDVVEIVTTRAQWPRLKGVRVHRASDLAPEHITVRHALPVTKPVRTMVDLGQSARWAVPDALERGLNAKLFNLTAVDVALHDLSRKGRPGVGILRRAVDQRALGRDVPESLLEVRMARLLQRHGLPRPEYQHWVTPTIRVDFAYPAPKVAIEVDGFGVHGTSAALSADLERQNELVTSGWIVLRFTWHQVVKQPDPVARTVLVTLTSASRRWRDQKPA